MRVFVHGREERWRDFWPVFTQRGRRVFTFLVWLQNHEREMREDMENKRQLVMMPEDWQKHMNATESHICNKSLVKDLYYDSMAVYDYDSGKYCGQSHRRCYHKAAKNKYVRRKIGENQKIK